MRNFQLGSWRTYSRLLLTGWMAALACHTPTYAETVFGGLLQPLIVRGEACVGSSGCTALTESFAPGVSLKIKDANPFLKFEDTLSSVDWGLRANDLTDSFSLQELTNGTIPLTVEAGAPDGALYVGSTGTVGFGTTAPLGNGRSIHIFGDSGQDSFSGIGLNPNVGPAFNFGYSGFSFGRSSGFFNVRPDASATAPNPSLRFATQNLQRMIIDRDGNVGIGQFGAVVGGSPGTSPLAKLHVQGNARIEGSLQVTGSIAVNGTTLTVPDYVFEPDYKLLPLKHLAAYIEKEKHLPGIPSAPEIQAQGKLDLGEMQMHLLKKVEELTLYTIQQNALVDDQKTAITGLQQTNEQQRAALATLLSRMKALEQAHAASR
jgi:hypothetical protein